MSQPSNQKTATNKEPSMFFIKRDSGEYEQIVMAEVLLPDTPNVYGDIYTKEAIREFAYEFARQGYGIDVNHDNEDVGGRDAIVVESFIVRAGDPDFIEGSWVVAMKILNKDLWAKILDGEINGYSFEAEAYMLPVVFQNLANRCVVGVTEPDPIDGHTHTYIVMLNAFNRPNAGATGFTNAHSHKIVTHTTTEFGGGLLGRVHNHRYQVIAAKDKGEVDAY